LIQPANRVIRKQTRIVDPPPVGVVTLQIVLQVATKIQQINSVYQIKLIFTKTAFVIYNGGSFIILELCNNSTLVMQVITLTGLFSLAVKRFELGKPASISPPKTG
jgi:hypothetical protein